MVQWNPSITDTFGDQHFVRYSEVSPTQRLPVGVVLCNPAVEYGDLSSTPSVSFHLSLKLQLRETLKPERLSLH